MKLIVNADDLGYTPAVNQAIFELHSRGRLSSASLMVNLPFSREAIDGLRAYPDLAVGVHLNLTKDRPLSSPGRIGTLLSPDGKFWPTSGFFTRAITGRIDPTEAEIELRAQIECLLDGAIVPSHLDTHSHWHLLPRFRALITRLAGEYQIPGIRQASLRRTLIPSGLWLAATARHGQPSSGFRISDYLLSLHQWMGADGEPVELFFNKELQRRIARPEVSLELVTHPGARIDPDFPPDTLLAHQRQWEMDFLGSPRFDEWLQRMDAHLIPTEKRSGST